MNYVLNWLDKTTMYRVVLYVLIFYIIVALGASIMGQLYFPVSSLIVSLFVMTLSGVCVHYVCRYITRAPANLESTLITILILFLIFDPHVNVSGLVTLAGVVAIAVASKYILAWRNLHILNPVVIAAVVASLSGLAYATWWIANPVMFASVVVGGLLITQKIRRFPLVLSTVLAGVLVFSFLALFNDRFSFDLLYMFFTAWPIVFFATVMVTEPLSTPAGTRNHILYGAMAGAISSMPFAFGPVYSSPELALLFANALFYFTTLKGRLSLSLIEKKKIAHDTWEFLFKPSYRFGFAAGQYLEWTIPHAGVDQRGIRRYFTIASAPHEEYVRLGLKIASMDKNEEGNQVQVSSYKQHLSSMETGDIIYATSLDGDFTLPSDAEPQQFVFIAGGIGVTPFSSIVRDMIHKKSKHQSTLFYCNAKEEDIAWQDLWDEANEKINTKTIHVLTEPSDKWKGEHGYIDAEMIKKHVDEYQECIYYISGPPGMVNAYLKLLAQMGVKKRRIITDFFPGLA